MDSNISTESIIKVSILAQKIDVKILINDDLDFDEGDNLSPKNRIIDKNITTTEINVFIDTFDKYPYNKELMEISNQIKNKYKTVENILDLYRKYGYIIINNKELMKEISSVSLIQYSINCVINSCNSNEIIFYNNSDRNLIITVAFLSNLGFMLLNVNKTNNILLDNVDLCSYGVATNIIENPYKLASIYLKNIGVKDKVCNLIEYILEIKIYNCIKEKLNGIKKYYNNQVDYIRKLIDTNNLGYDIDNFKDIEKLENFKFMEVIDKCMCQNIGNCKENEINLYLNEFIKPKLNSCINE